MLNFDSIVFGPIRSRRLGSSLGINLLPAGAKICNFDCIYCECGWNADSAPKGCGFPSFEAVCKAIEQRFEELGSSGTRVDSITFSGNGEPTLHPGFDRIIDFTVRMRDLHLPSARISVLSNATMLLRESVLEALSKVDNPILKLDAPTDAQAAIVNRPAGNYRVEDIIEKMCALKGNFILQTMFMHGAPLDYSLDAGSLAKWMDIVRRVRPRLVMVYTVDRDTPDKGLTKMSVEEMKGLLEPLAEEGFNIQING